MREEIGSDHINAVDRGGADKQSKERNVSSSFRKHAISGRHLSFTELRCFLYTCYEANHKERELSPSIVVSSKGKESTIHSEALLLRLCAHKQSHKGTFIINIVIIININIIITTTISIIICQSGSVLLPSPKYQKVAGELAPRQAVENKAIAPASSYLQASAQWAMDSSWQETNNRKTAVD